MQYNMPKVKVDGKVKHFPYTKKGKEVGVKVKDKVRAGDEVYEV